MIKFGSKVKIRKEFKNGFYEGCDGIVLGYNPGLGGGYEVELRNPMGVDTKVIKIIVDDKDYLTKI